MVKKMGKLIGVASKAGGGRITFKAKEGATLARAFEDFEIGFSPVGNDGLVEFVVNSHSGPIVDGIIGVDRFDNQGPYPGAELKTEWITSIGLPKITPKISKESHGKFAQGDDEDPLISVGFNVSKFRLPLLNYAAIEFASAKEAVKEQKQWHTANYRMRLGDLPCSRVSKIDAISIKQSFADVDGDGVPDLSRSISPITFTIPLSDSGPFVDWFNAAANGRVVPMPLQVTYMDDETPLFSLDLMVQPVSVDYDDVFTDPYRKDGNALVKVIQIDQQKLDSILNLIR